MIIKHEWAECLTIHHKADRVTLEKPTTQAEGCRERVQEPRAAVVEQIQAYLCEVLAESRSASVAAIGALVDPGDEIDSLEGVELILAVEAQYGVRLEDDVVSRVCRSIPQLARAV